MSETLNKRIETSLDWMMLENTLLRQSNKLTHNREISKMIANIGKEVSELSKAEVTARQGKRLKAYELLNKINNDIEIVEEFILIAALLG
jgi:hypothetical protein